MADSTIRGRFVWHELVTTDPKSAGAFFSKIIGWKTKPWGNDNSYTLFTSGDRQRAGLMVIPEAARSAGAPPSWLTYIGTPSVDETARQAAALGATVKMPPADIPNVGRYAVIADPQGAVFGLYTPNQAPGPDAEPTVGEFSWHELATTDAKAAFDFYQKLFGWEETSSMDMGEMGMYRTFGLARNARMQGGMFNKPSQMPGPSTWLAYIKVPDAKRSAEAIKNAGAKVINGPMEVPGGDWITQALDPQGGMFAVHSAAPAAAAPTTRTSAPRTPGGAKRSMKKAAPSRKKRVAAQASTTKKKKPSAKRAAKRTGKRAAKKRAAKKRAAKRGKKGKR